MCFACEPECGKCDYHWRGNMPDYVSKLCNDCATAADPWDIDIRELITHSTYPIYKLVDGDSISVHWTLQV